MEHVPAPAASPSAALPPHAPARPWQLGHPLWQCGFRPFFVATVLACIGLLGLWLLFLGAGWPLPAVPGGAVVWHVHELLMGASLAAVAGFALTAVPEFTDTPSFAARHVRWLVVLWLLGRLSFWLSGWWPTGLLALSGVFHVAFMALLTALVTPRLWRDPGHRQQGFGWAFLALLVTVAGFYVDAVRDEFPMRWLHVMLGVLMALIVVAMSRISMAIVNGSIDDDIERRHAAASGETPVVPGPGALAPGESGPDMEDGHGPARQVGQEASRRMSADIEGSGPAPAVQAALPAEEEEPAAYLARPPRRHMAVICITLFSIMQWFAPDGRVTGWLALAASAAMLNLLNDWHVGRPLFSRWPLMLYAVYVFMAAGYGLIGLTLVAGQGSVSPGIHLLTAGALGLAIYAVICIAGYTHSGLEKNGRPWVVMGAWLLGVGAALRALAHWFDPPLLLTLAGMAWCAAFVLQGWQMLPVFLRPRADGLWGCQGVQD